MKKLFAALTLALAAHASAPLAEAATAFNTLIINRTDGGKEYLALAIDYNVLAVGDAIRIKHPKITIEFAMADVENFTFGDHKFGEGSVYEGDHALSAIDTVESADSELTFGDGEISSSRTITVYDLKGTEVARGNTVDTTSLPAGIYIVKAGKSSFKIKL